MQPDVKRERRAGWLSLGASLLLCGSALGWYASDNGLDDQLRSVKADHDQRIGPERMSEHVAKQEQANRALQANIEELKRGVGFTVTPFFSLKAGDTDAGTQPGTVFKDRFAKVHDELSQIAYNKNIKYDEYVGFAKEKDVPPGQQVPFLLAMLQLTRKATLIAFGTPTPIARFDIQHDQKAAVTGPKGHPLQREYSLTMEVTGSLRDVLWILFHLSVAEPMAKDAEDPGGYPLVIKELSITSGVTSEVLNASEIIQQIKLKVRLAGIQFLTDDQRGARAATPAAPTRPSRLGAIAPSAPSSGGSSGGAPASGVGARP